MFNLRNYGIGIRLIMTTIGALGLMLAIVAIALYNIGRIGERVDHIVDDNLRKTDLAAEMRVRNLQIGQHLRSALILSDSERQQEEKARIEADFTKYIEAESKLVEGTTTPAGTVIVP